MKIERENLWCYVRDATEEEERELDKLLSFPVANREWAFAHHLETDHLPRLRGQQRKECQRIVRQAKRSFEKAKERAIALFPKCWKCKWDWAIHFYQKGRFPSGLLFMVSLPHELVDKRTISPDETSAISCNIELRDYQQAAHDAILESQQGIVQVPTGGGKTEIAIKTVADVGLPTLILVPTTPIFNEFRSRWEKYCPDEPLGIIAKGKFQPERVTLSIFDNSWAQDHRGEEMIRRTRFVYVDEAHRAAAKTWYEYLMRLENAVYRIGQTATPIRETDVEQAKLHALFGPLIYELRTPDLQDEGWICKAKIYMLPVPVPKISGSFDVAYRHAIVQNERRNELITEAAFAAASKGLRTLIVVNWDEHAERLLPSTGGIYFTGGESAKKIAEKKKRFISDMPLAIGTPVVDMGFDAPNIDVLIMAGAGKSPISTQQRLGRSLRIAMGKEHAIVIDFWDDDEDIFLEQSQERKQLYERLEQEVLLVNSIDDIFEHIE